jgi:hypothetical protein
VGNGFGAAGAPAIWAFMGVPVGVGDAS